MTQVSAAVNILIRYANEINLPVSEHTGTDLYAYVGLVQWATDNKMITYFKNEGDCFQATFSIAVSSFTIYSGHSSG